jgi:hypothetical protein
VPARSGESPEAGFEAKVAVAVLATDACTSALFRRNSVGWLPCEAGDSLFPGGVGNTQKDAARFAGLIDDVEARLFGELPDDTWVYPGHGKDTTIGAERPHLAEWRERGW